MSIRLDARGRLRSRIGFRSAAVAGLALVLTACLPAPVGDPEKSRVDERLNGIWYDAKQKHFWIFRPWDKRTWLVRFADMQFPEEAPPEAGAAPSPEGAAPAPADAPPVPESGNIEKAVPWQGMKAAEFSLWKTWKTHLGGERFLTLESVQEMDNETGFNSPAWVVMKAEIDGDQLTLTDLDTDFEALEVEETADAIEAGTMTRDQASRKFESVIAQNAKNPDLYRDKPRILTRIPQNQYDDVADALGLEGNFDG